MGTMPPPASTPPGTGDGLPCEVRRIVQSSCSNCHGTTPKFGAPQSLVTAAHFQALRGAETMGQRVLARVADDARPMPPQPYARLGQAERQVLESWIARGSPAEQCAEPPPAGTSPPAAGTTPPSAGTTPPADADVKCHSIVARASKAATKYSVPTTPDLYQCFSYALPWGQKKVQMVSARPIVDNDKVLHHWILYNNASAVTDGSNSSCAGLHRDAANVAGWAPGGQPMVLPGDVGLRMESGGFTLEVHYNNNLGPGQLDASGVEVCVTEKLRPNEAAVHWLGTQNLNKLNATGTCDPANQGPVTILASTPHMHLQGRHMKTVINRVGGGTDVLIDEPFDFNTQISYATPAVVNPGDTLTTTCTYAAPTPFGEGTNEEMCYNFVLAYPAGGLAQSLQLLRKYDCTGR